MPQAADFNVNNGAGTPASKTFTSVVPAAGIGGEARWELQEGQNSGVFPTFSAVLRTDASIKGYDSVVKHRYPSVVTDSVTGVTKAGPTAEFIGTVKMPNDFPEADKAHFVAYVTNALALSLWKQFLRGRVAMT